jgi:hypothetical protein
LTLAAGEAVRAVHLDWAWVVITTNGIAGAWALAAHRIIRLRVKQLWWLTAVAQIAVFVQVVLGVALIQGLDTEAYQFHMLYGFTAAFAVAIIYSYRAQLQPHLYLLYGFGGLFVTGLAIRALEVGPT